MKIKTCSICNKETYLWKSNPASCKDCWLKIKAQEQSSEPKSYNVSKTKQSPAKRIKSVSTKKLAELKDYRVVRDRYLKNNPICEYPNCTSREVELHHRAGRSGKLLCDDTYFCSLCRAHHIWVELHVKESKELGLSVNRLNV
jgi:hypothetical protein